MSPPLHLEKTRPIRPGPSRAARRAARVDREPCLRVPAPFLEPLPREDLAAIDKGEAAIVVDKLLVAVARHESVCRARIGRLAVRLLDTRAYHRLGFARLGDYTTERLGLSAREIQSAAQVARAVEPLPRLGQALHSGELNWTKLRTVCAHASAADVEHWIARAQTMTSRELEAYAKDVGRAAPIGDRNSSADVACNAALSTPERRDAAPVEPDADDPDFIDGEPRAELHIYCPAHLRALWRDVSELASRSAGSVLAGWQALELVAAEGASGTGLHNVSNGESSGEPIIDDDVLEVDDDIAKRFRAFGAHVRTRDSDAESPRERRVGGWDVEWEVLRALVATNGSGLAGNLEDASPVFTPSRNVDSGGIDALSALSSESNANNQNTPHCTATDRKFGDLNFECPDLGDPDLPHTMDADQIDDALRAVLASMRNIDWQLGRLLATFSRLGLHRHIGYASLAVYVRERLGLSSRKARALVRIEGNPAEGRDALSEAYRSGRISWVRALALLPVVSERHADAWIERAERVTVRRLFDEVRWALDVRDRTWLFMELVPPDFGAKLEHSDAAAERQMRALYDDAMVDRIRERPPLDNTSLHFSGPISVIELFHEVLQSYSDRRKVCEAPWRALERLLLHVRAQWSCVPRHRNPIHERDGWRCRVPGCSSRRNLQEHHVLFRSRGGGNQRGNRISICAWHHLRGIHAGLVRAHGNAETGIHWQLGNGLRLIDDAYL